MKRIKRLLVLSLTLLSLFGMCSLQFAAVASADKSADNAKNSACAGIGGTESGGTCTTAGPSINKTLKVVINTLSVLVGITAVIMMIIGGLKYITSAGDSGKITSAKNTIVYAVIGLVVVALSQTIVHFVLHETNVTPKASTSKSSSP